MYDIICSKMFLDTANVSVFLLCGNIEVHPELKRIKYILGTELDIWKFNFTLHISCIIISQIYTKNSDLNRYG